MNQLQAFVANARPERTQTRRSSAGTNGDIFSLVVKSGDNNKITGHQ